MTPIVYLQCGNTSHLSLEGANSSRRLPSLTTRLCICPPLTTIPPPTASVSPIIVASTHRVHTIYRSDQRSIPIPARTNVHSFKPVVQSPEPTPATTTCPDTNTSRTDARTRLAVENATYFARILHLIPQVYASASLSRFWLIASPPILCTTPAYMCLCSC